MSLFYIQLLIINSIIIIQIVIINNSNRLVKLIN